MNPQKIIRAHSPIWYAFRNSRHGNGNGNGTGTRTVTVTRTGTGTGTETGTGTGMGTVTGTGRVLPELHPELQNYIAKCVFRDSSNQLLVLQYLRACH